MTRGHFETSQDTGGGLVHDVQFTPPAPALRPYLSGYYGYDIRCDPDARFEEIFFPTWVSIRIAISSTRWAMRIGDVRFDPVPGAALFGPATRAGVAEFGAGRLIGTGISSRGWARLFGGDVSGFADRIVPLDAILGADAQPLREAALEADGHAAQVAIIQDFLLERLAERPPESPMIAAVQAMLMAPGSGSIDAMAARAGMAPWKFARFCKRNFGFTPKKLIRRARFMRTMAALRADHGRAWPELIDPGYSDQSHFIRDCRDFIGMSPGQFLARTRTITTPRRARPGQAATGAPPR